MGLNAVCLPGLPVGAVFRSSLPATPVATPIHREFQHFTEQAIRDRLCKTPSPRKAQMFMANSPAYAGFNAFERDMGEGQPMDMDITSPINETLPEVSAKDEECRSGGGDLNRSASSGAQPRHHDEASSHPSSINPNERRIFVGNISYRVGDDKSLTDMRRHDRRHHHT